MKSWKTIYQDRLNDRYRNHIKNKYAKFIEIVQDSNDRFAEFGCGAGFLSRAILSNNPNSKHVCLDICPDMLALTKENLKDFDNFITLQHDILKPFNQLDLKGYSIHSHGVLEHFNDQEIKVILKYQKQVSNERSFHYVPGFKYQIPSRGDERLLTKDQWNSICRPSEIIEFNDGYDYVLVFNGSK
jgi:SAM-dependent methyltransferase